MNKLLPIVMAGVIFSLMMQKMALEAEVEDLKVQQHILENKCEEPIPNLNLTVCSYPGIIGGTPCEGHSYSF